MRSQIFPVSDPNSFGYQTPDGSKFLTIGQAAKHLARLRPAVVNSPAVSPVAKPATATWGNVTNPALMRLLELRKELRIAEAVLDAVPTLPATPWSASHRHNLRLKANARHSVTRLRRMIAAHRRKHCLPVQKMFKPRPSTAADARIGRQYRSDACMAMFKAKQLAGLLTAPN